MKKFYALTLVFSVILMLNSSAQSTTANTGIYQTFVFVDVNNGGNQTLAGGINSELWPDNYNGSAFNTVTSLTLNGGEVKTYKNGGGDVTGAQIWYSVFPASGSIGAFTAINLPHNEDLPTPGNQKWQEALAGVDLLFGLAPGDYVIQVYFEVSTNQGTIFDSNPTNDYRATFTVECPTADCDAGYYCDAPNCVACAIGSFNPIPGQTECQLCPPGRFSSTEGSEFCDVCPVDTYQDLSGAATCIPCPAGSTSQQGATACDCPAGETWDNGACVTTPVPTLGQWGLILFGLLLLCSGAIVVWRRQFSVREARA